MASKKQQRTGKNKQTNIIPINNQNIHNIVNVIKTLYGMIQDAHVVLNTHFLRGIVEKFPINNKDVSSLSQDILRQIPDFPLKEEDIDSIFIEVIQANNAWKNHTYVCEEDGQIVIEKSKKECIAVSNFTLRPKYKVEVHGGNTYHVYNVHVLGDFRTHQIILTASDFSDLGSLQEQIKKQLAHTSASITNCSAFMKDLVHKYITLPKWKEVKRGTSLLGLERLENDGPKYFCTPHGVYDVRTGEKSEDIIYMGNEEANIEEIRTWTNLGYDPEKWPDIAKEFMTNILDINERKQMLKIVGWMFAIPHEYVLRKETGFGAFPHLHILGEPGSGKTTLMTILKQYMGHNDTTPRQFTSAFELQKLLNTSYTIPAVLDEYGKRWNAEKHTQIDQVLVESFTRGRFSKGRSDLSSVYYKYKNPLLMGGQTPVQDLALSQRVVEAHVSKAFHNTQRGQRSKRALEQLQKVPDKNFWVGYCMWAARHTNEEVLNIQRQMLEKTKMAGITDHRRSYIYSFILTGLRFYEKLYRELIDRDYVMPDNDIQGVLEDEILAIDEQNTELDLFMRAVANLAKTHGNSTNYYGKNFGKYKNVMYVEPSKSKDDPGTFGNSKKQEACIYGRDLILIKVPEMARKLKMNPEEIQMEINSEFARSMQNKQSESNLVLAPRQYRTKGGYYTAFSAQEVLRRYPEFETVMDLIQSDPSDVRVKTKEKTI